MFFHLIYANWTSYKFSFSCWEKAFFIMYTIIDFGHGKFCNRPSWGTQWMNREDEHNGIKLNTNSISPFPFVLHQNPYLWTLLYNTCLLIKGLPKILKLHFTWNILTSDLMIEKEHMNVAFVELKEILFVVLNLKSCVVDDNQCMHGMTLVPHF